MYKHFLSIKSYSCNSLVITLPTRQKKTSICNNNPCIPRTWKMYHKSTQSRNSPLETLLSKVGEFLSSFYISISFLRNCRSTCTSPFDTRRKETLNLLWTEKKASPRWEETVFTISWRGIYIPRGKHVRFPTIYQCQEGNLRFRSMCRVKVYKSKDSGRYDSL